MAIHPSLNSSEKDKRPRSVLKRIERLRTMMDKNQWKEGDDIYGLPKIKTVRIKIKKEKAEKAEAAATATGPAAESKEKEATPAKEAAAKTQTKK